MCLSNLLIMFLIRGRDVARLLLSDRTGLDYSITSRSSHRRSNAAIALPIHGIFSAEHIC